MEADQLRRLRFGSDIARDLEGLTERTAVFLWNYERGRLHGVFAGTRGGMEGTPRDAVFLYEVRARLIAKSVGMTVWTCSWCVCLGETWCVCSFR